MLREVLLGKATAYRNALGGEPGKVVLADLARFCHAMKTTHVYGDTHGTAQLEGRRQVFLRISEFLNLTPADINRISEEIEE